MADTETNANVNDAPLTVPPRQRPPAHVIWPARLSWMTPLLVLFLGAVVLPNFDPPAPHDGETNAEKIVLAYRALIEVGIISTGFLIGIFLGIYALLARPRFKFLSVTIHASIGVLICGFFLLTFLAAVVGGINSSIQQHKRDRQNDAMNRDW